MLKRSLNTHSLLREVDSLLDLGGQILDHKVISSLLTWAELRKRQDILHSLGSKLNWGSKELAAILSGHRRLDKGALNNALLARGSLEQSVEEVGSRIGHGESSRSSAVLSLNDLITTELDALGEGLDISLREACVLDLGEKG